MGRPEQKSAAEQVLVYANAYIATLSADEALCTSRYLAGGVKFSIALMIRDHHHDGDVMAGQALLGQLTLTVMDRLVATSVGSTVDHPNGTCECAHHATHLLDRIHEITKALTRGGIDG